MDYDQKCLKQLEMQFFVIAQNTFNKIFKQWIQPPLLPAMIGCDKKAATMFARWIQQGTYVPMFIADFYEMCLFDAATWGG